MDPAPSWLDEPLPLTDEPPEDDPDGGIFRGGAPEPGADGPAQPRDRGLATGVASREELAAKITDRLNPEQARAVTTTEGPLLILAGAGSGKTRVVAHRVAYLVGVKNVAPWRILAVTFTNKAAGEMRERIIALVGPDDGRKVEMGTFHALCARILRRDGAAIGLSPRFVIYDTDDQQSLMKQAFRDLDLPIQGGALRPRSVLEAISRAKNNLESVEDLVEGATTHHEREVARIATRYTERLRAAGALDFDDLLVETVRLLETQPEVLARYQARWRYLHVDEYQDTNAAQYRIVRALAAAHHNLCVVGDDDQSIYAWRGADLRNILDFERDEPGATVVKLEQNYRSTELILRAAHAVVANNEGRKEKELWTERAGGRPIARFEAWNEEEEAEWIARQVESLLGGRAAALTRRADETDRLRPKEIAVLYRTNAQSRAIEEAFLRYGLRYQLIGGTRFYQRREVKDALAYLRVLRSDTDVVGYERIINLPARGIGDRTLEILRMAAAEPEQTYWSGLQRAAAGELLVLGARARAAVADFAALVRRLRSRIGILGLPELLDEVLEVSGYRAMLADGTEENEERWRNLLELRSVTTRYDDLAPDDALDRLLEETALVADQDAYEADADAVTLITLHAAKGLEFGAVFISGMEEGVFPHSRALDDTTQLEEERRLAYVGITRAKERLFLSHAWRRATWGPGGGGPSVPSRFLFEIPADLMEGPRLEPGDEGDAAYDLDLAFDARRSSRFGTAIRAGGGAHRTGSGRPGAPVNGEPFVPVRDLAARRAAFNAGAPSGSLAVPGRSPFADRSANDDDHPDAAFPDDLPVRQLPPRVGAAPARPASAPRLRVPGERLFRDGDRVVHARFGDGVVVTSKLTRDDEEVTVAFRSGGVKTLLASMAHLEHAG
ncbi:MAG TPA: UvrD-helicase domain-containing protein [Candidatus Nanopelagicales bacterium]|nr:UvrD-helicase domain-containing protein [Candidatus Nanopelagicales bacterium]